MVKLLPLFSEPLQSLSQEQRFQTLRDRLKSSRRTDISFNAEKCHCSGNTSKVLKVFWRNYSLVFPPLPVRGHLLTQLPVLVDSVSFLYSLLLTSLFFPLSNTSLTSFLSLPHPPSLLSSSLAFYYHIQLCLSLILFNPCFPFPS